MKGLFDLDKFYGILDAERAARSLNWKQVADQSGVSASTLTRMNYGKRPDVDGLAALLAWGGFQTDAFVSVEGGQAPETMTQIATLLRNDPRLDAASRAMLEGAIRSVYDRLPQ